MDKDNFGKNYKKIIWKNTTTIHSVLKKETYKAKFLISSILKKIKSRETILEKKITKKNQKKGGKSCWKHCSNSQCFVMKAIVLPT
jgi:hypothetical protein